MNLTVRIHDKAYVHEVAQGVTFTEEYNETLDSGVVRLSHIKGQIVGLKPYDDVYIYESAPEGEDETKWFDSHIGLWRRGGTPHDGDEIDEETGVRIPFYRHLLVDKFTEDIINLSEDIYSYSLELFSETKGLEVVQLPNISVTQPLVVSKKIDIYTYLVRFVNLYSPKYKKYKIIHDDDKNVDINSWEYMQKYTVAPELKSIFSGFYSQDFSLSNPNLRDVLSSLMITLDMIPYVKDNVIYAKAISERTETPWGTKTYDLAALQKNGMISRIVGQMGSSDFCDGVRRQYSDALSQDGTCNFIEYLGFRNKNNALITLDNMRLETAHKIYKIKKINMCYYKKAGAEELSTAQTQDVWIFCKYDILPLVKNYSEYSVLSQDWRDKPSFSPSLEEYSKYKISTVYYNIGGNTIEGWSNRYNEVGTATLSAWDVTKTTIENIITAVENTISGSEISSDDLANSYFERYNVPTQNEEDEENKTYKIIPYYGMDFIFKYENISKATIALKTIFFEIEYEGFYDGAIIHSRDSGRDNIISNDNSSSSLTLLEKDGLSQKEKLNRFANKTHLLKGRLEGDNYSIANILKLGNTGAIGADDDVIIYRREYSIFNNYILVSYAGIQDYVLKNFYTSVYAKYRTYQLMSYGESVNRAENKKMMLLLSCNKKIKDEKTFFEITGDLNGYDTISRYNIVPFSHSWWNGLKGRTYIWTGITAPKSVVTGKIYYIPIRFNDSDAVARYIVRPTSIDAENSSITAICIDWEYDENLENKRIETRRLLSAFSQSNSDEKINTAIISLGNKESFYAEMFSFSCGKSLCLSSKMTDNISGGNYVEKWVADWSLLLNHPSDKQDYYVGSTQNWYNIVDDQETGAIKTFSFTFEHRTLNPVLCVKATQEDVKPLDDLYRYTQMLPRRTDADGSIIDFDSSVKNVFSFENETLYKDNKESIDMTVQVDVISEDPNNIVFSDYLIKLSDLIIANDITKNDNKERVEKIYYHYGTVIKFAIKNTGIQYVFSSILMSKTDAEYIIAQKELKGVNNKYPFSAYLAATQSFVFVATHVYWDIDEYEQKPAIFLVGNGGYTNHDNKYIPLTEIELTPGTLNEEDPILGTKEVYSYDSSFQNIEYEKDSEFGTEGKFVLYQETKAEIESNMFIEFSNKQIDKTIESQIIKYNEAPNFSNIRPAEVFEIIGGGDDSILRVNLVKNIGENNEQHIVPQGTKSIRYWFLDFASAYSKNYDNNTDIYSYDPNRSGYHFVFGVNVTEADFERGYIDIYITKTTNRDERVYDSVGRQVGIVHNCIDSNGNYEPPKYQTFDPTNITQFEKITFRNEIGVKGWVSTTGEHYYTLGENVYAYIYPTETALDINGDLAWKIYDSAGTLLKTYESGGNNNYFEIDFMFDGKAAVAIACVIPKKT